MWLNQYKSVSLSLLIWGLQGLSNHRDLRLLPTYCLDIFTMWLPSHHPRWLVQLLSPSSQWEKAKSGWWALVSEGTQWESFPSLSVGKDRAMWPHSTTGEAENYIAGGQSPAKMGRDIIHKGRRGQSIGGS